MRHVVRTTDADCDFHGNCKRPACSLQQFLSLNRIVLTTEEKIGGISARHSNLFEKRLPDPPGFIHPSHFARVTVCLSTIRDPSVRPSERDDGDEANTRPSDRCRRSERRPPFRPFVAARIIHGCRGSLCSPCLLVPYASVQHPPVVRDCVSFLSSNVQGWQSK